MPSTTRRPEWTQSHPIQRKKKTRYDMAFIRMKSLIVEPEGSTKQIPKLQTSDAILNQLLTTSKHIPPETILMLAYHLLLGLLRDCFPRGLFTERLYEFSVPSIRATAAYIATPVTVNPKGSRNSSLRNIASCDLSLPFFLRTTLLSVLLSNA